MSNLTNSEIPHTKGRDLVRINTNLAIHNGDFIIEEGKKLVEDNEYFKDLMELMEIPKFRDFLEKYFYNTKKIKNSTINIKLYETLQKNFKEKNPDYPEDKSKYIIVYCLFNMLSEENYKKKLITLTTDYIKNTNDKTLYQEIKNIPK